MGVVREQFVNLTGGRTDPALTKKGCFLLKVNDRQFRSGGRETIRGNVQIVNDEIEGRGTGPEIWGVGTGKPQHLEKRPGIVISN